MGPGFAACLVCGATAATFQRLAATSCGRWAARLPPRVAALLLLGDGLQCGGGSPAAFAEALHRRMRELPAAPD
jgi:hypothetical protein